ncbi:MAG: hypothetical protein ACRBF0_24860 [Calditrichia bacterium]
MTDNFERLDKNVDKFYRSKEMSSEMMEHLKKTIEGKHTVDASPESVPGRDGYYVRQYMAVAAIFFLLFGFYIVQSYASNRWQEDVSRQVAKNHLKALEMEHRTNDYEVLAEALGKLDFALVAPNFSNEGYQLLGGRYCSIDQQIAAQINLKNMAGERCTLYQFKLPVNLLARFPDRRTLKVDGLTVELWKENGLGMGLAYSDGGGR